MGVMFPVDSEKVSEVGCSAMADSPLINQIPLAVGSNDVSAQAVPTVGLPKRVVVC